MTIGIGASAQTDGFFGGNDAGCGDRTTSLPIVPSEGVGNLTHDENGANAPLGNGLVVLTVLGVGYAMRRVKSRE